MLTGLWHGASWNFVLWGLYYALLLIGEKLFLGKLLERLPRLVQHALLVVIAGVGWMLFYFEDIGEACRFLGRLFVPAAADAVAVNRVLAYLPIFLVCALASTPLAARLYARVKDHGLVRYGRIAVLAVLLLLCAASLATQSYNPFIYFRF